MYFCFHIEEELHEELYGVGRVLRRDYDTVLIELYRMKPIKTAEEYDYAQIAKQPVLVMHWCYDTGLQNGHWKVIDYKEVPERVEMPYFWTQDAGDMKYYISKGMETSFSTEKERIEISKEEIWGYNPEGIGNEISETRRYVRRLEEAGLLKKRL